MRKGLIMLRSVSELIEDIANKGFQLVLLSDLFSPGCLLGFQLFCADPEMNGRFLYSLPGPKSAPDRGYKGHCPMGRSLTNQKMAPSIRDRYELGQ